MSNLSKSPSGNNRVYLHAGSSVAQPSTSVSVPNRRVVRVHSPENKGKIQSNVQTFDKYKRPGSNNNNDQVSSRAVNDRGRKHPLSSSESTQVISEGNDIVSSRRPIQVRTSNRQKNHSPSAIQNDNSSSKELEDSFVANDFYDSTSQETKILLLLL